MYSVITDLYLPQSLILLPIWHFCNFKDHNSSPNLLFKQMITKHLHKHLNAMRCVQGGKAHLYSLTTSKPKTHIKSKLLLCVSPELRVGAWQITKEDTWGCQLKSKFQFSGFSSFSNMLQFSLRRAPHYNYISVPEVEIYLPYSWCIHFTHPLHLKDYILL